MINKNFNKLTNSVVVKTITFAYSENLTKSLRVGFIELIAVGQHNVVPEWNT